MTIVEDPCVITGGVDTHADMHVAAALDLLGGLLGVREFPATAAGYADLLSWLSGFGNLALAGVEGTGSYGAGLARYLAAAASGSRRSIARTARTAAGRASLIRWTRSAPRGLPCPGGRPGCRRAGTGRWRRSGR